MSAMPTYAMTYVVAFADALGPGRNVVKVGRAWRFARVMSLVANGGQVFILARGTDWTWEREALRSMRRWFPPAFRSELDAWAVLPRGRGWTECFEVDDAHLELAVDLCFEGFARGSEQGVNEERAAEDRWVRPRMVGVSAGSARGETDRPGVVDDGDGRAGAPGVGAGTDRGVDLPWAGGDGDGGRASVDAGGLGVSGDLSGGGVGVDRVATPAPSGHPTCVVELPRPSSRRFANVRGCGGRARGCAGAGGRAGAGRAGRAGGRVGGMGGKAGAHRTSAGTAAADGRPAPRVPRSPSREVRRLRQVRDRSPTTRPMGRGAPVRRADGELRAGAGRR